MMVKGFSQIDSWASNEFSCGVKDGHALCWGTSSNGLGDGQTKGSATPVTVVESIGGGALSKVSLVDVGEQLACVVSDGSVFCWGTNGSGQLGIGSEVPETSPVPMQVQTASGPLSNVESVSVGSSSACAVTSSHEAYCWGQNQFGQTAVSPAGPDVVVATKVADLMNHVVQVSVGNVSAGAILDDGSVYVWGGNTSGQLGNGTQTGQSSIPVQLTQAGKAVMNVKKLVMGTAGYVLLSSGTVLTWGIGKLTPQIASDNNSPFLDAWFLGSSGCVIRSSGSVGGVTTLPPCP
jgi:alpha-tubulin suppressor-like RCC1 family protein